MWPPCTLHCTCAGIASEMVSRRFACKDLVNARNYLISDEKCVPAISPASFLEMLYNSTAGTVFKRRNSDRGLGCNSRPHLTWSLDL